MFPVLIPVRRRALGPQTAGLIATLGGALVLLGAFFLPFNTPLAVGVGVAGFVLGPAIIALAALATSRPHRAGAAGVAIIVLGGASLLAGGGFYLGWLFGIVGGALIGSPCWRTSPRAASPAFSFDALGPLCPTCGRHVPTWSARCPHCGASESIPPDLRVG
ncbi:MAG: DUF6114 domain-containing protein [Thermoplasmata archaeon]|nr:DUF6114 domain-containing protein [Thermoplasmata archaeon]